MSASYVLNLQQSAGRSGPVAAAPYRLASGAARSLRAHGAMQLRVVSGQAWVTLGAGQPGWLEASGDVLLNPGQSLEVAPGQQAVLEPQGGQPLQYQWRSA